MKGRYLPFLKRRLTIDETLMGRARELIFKAAVFTNMDSKAGSLVPSYTSKVTGSVSEQELMASCANLLSIAPSYTVDAYCVEKGIVEVVNLAMLELLLYQKQHCIENTVKTTLKLQNALYQLNQHKGFSHVVDMKR